VNSNWTAGDPEVRQRELPQDLPAIGDDQHGLIAAEDREAMLVEQAEVPDVADRRCWTVGFEEIDHRQRAELDFREANDRLVNPEELGGRGLREPNTKGCEKERVCAGEHGQPRV
jgi:hypothetical protein